MRTAARSAATHTFSEKSAHTDPISMPGSDATNARTVARVSAVASAGANSGNAPMRCHVSGSCRYSVSG